MQRNRCNSDRNSFRSNADDCSDSRDYIVMLENELKRLRESTKQALHQSWDEVEILQQEFSEHLELSTQIEEDLVKSRQSEEVWRKRCLAAEKLAGLQPPAEPAPIRYLKRLSSNISNRGMVIPKEDDENVESELVEKKDAEIENLQKVIEDNDETIYNLRQDVIKHKSMLKSVETETKCMVTAHLLRLQNQNNQIQVLESKLKTKEDQVQVLEAHLKTKENQVQVLETQVKTKENQIRELDRKIIAFRDYVDDLANEIEDTCCEINEVCFTKLQ